jgi:hypothetical protein
VRFSRHGISRTDTVFKSICFTQQIGMNFVSAGTTECYSAVDQLGSEVEKLKQLMTPGSSFIPTGNHTMSAWGKSGYSHCQLPFSWTELIKVLKFYSLLSHCVKEGEVVFRTGGLGRHMQENVYESWVCTIFAVIPSSAGSITRSTECSHHGDPTVSYFLSKDCK